MHYCQYYQATIERSRAWFFVAALRSYDYVCFDRTYDTPNSIFEFFVPENQEEDFLLAMRYFQEEGIVQTLNKLPNRLAQDSQDISVWE